MLCLKLTQELRAAYICRLLISVKEAGKLEKTLRERERESNKGERERGKEMSHHHHHQAVDNLINVFARASHDLNAVHFKLDKEFQQIYPENVSNFYPVLESRILWIQARSIIQFVNSSDIFFGS